MQMSTPMFVAQAMVEKGALDGMAAGLTAARDRIEIYVGEGNAVFVVVGAIVLVLLVLMWRR
jgi:hypothetical protein